MKFLNKNWMLYFAAALGAVWPKYKAYYNGDYRQPSFYEHFATGIILMALSGVTHWSVAFVGFGLHVMWKEFIYDKLVLKKALDWPNIVERSLGFLVGLPLFLMR